MRNPEVFHARIYGNNEDEFQDLYCYIVNQWHDVVDVEIKMPILIKPACLRDDVAACLYSYDKDLILGDLKHTYIPENVVLAP